METKDTSLAVVQPTSLGEFNASYDKLVGFVKSKLKLDVDYGVIPGTTKKSLYKPGAEKIAFLFNLKPELELIKSEENWETGFFFYKYKCTLVHFQTGKHAGEAIRSCNSNEKKYATTSKAEKWATADEKAAAIGRKTVKKGQWDNVYLILKKTPEEAAELVNTIDAMAQKRAIVAAVVQATMATEIFDADVSDYEDEAPKRSVTKAEDPRRQRLFMQLYGRSGEKGLDDEWLHRAAKKKYGIEDSLNELSNTQIEELLELIQDHYEDVPKGTEPQLKNKPAQPTGEPVTPEPVQDGEIVDGSPQDDEITFCRGPRHNVDERPPTTMDTPWCSKECENDYYGPPKQNRPWENKEKLKEKYHA